jgi:rare lipoprotein A
VAIESKTGYDSQHNLMISEEHFFKAHGNILPHMLKNITATSLNKLHAGLPALFLLVSGGLIFPSCFVAKATYELTTGVIKTTYKVTKTAGKAVYVVGDFTFDVVKAPLDWPLTNNDMETIDGLSPKEAIRLGRVKTSPYVVKGKHYEPMSVAAANSYREKGIASWYGYETYKRKGGQMTANGEAFHPNKLTAAHKLLPLPTFVRVTNLENGRSLIVRVNDRGPFYKDRLIDLCAGAARKLGFDEQGTARVLVETVQIDEG